MATKVSRTRAGESKTDKAELPAVLGQIEKRFGKVATPGSEILQPERIPTGIFMFDMATLGGVPYNRIVHVVGHRSAGKSTAADIITANAQAMFPDQRAVKIDTEGTHESVWSGKLGVDQERLIVVQPETGEAAIDIADAMVHTREVSIIVVDSIAALVPMKEVDDSAEDQNVGLQARLVGKMIRKLTSGLIKERQRGHFVTVLLVNQYRSKIGGWSPNGDPTTVPGGRALEFAATLNWVMKNKEEMGKDEHEVEVVARNTHVFQITKNKMNGGIRSGEFDLIRTADPEFGLPEGYIDDVETMLAYAKKFGAYTGGGSNWKLSFLDDEHSVHGVNEAKTLLYNDPELKWRLRNHLIHEHAAHLNMPESFLARFRP